MTDPDAQPSALDGAHYDPHTDRFFDDHGREIVDLVIRSGPTWVDWTAPVVVPDPDDYTPRDECRCVRPRRSEWLGVAAVMVLSTLISVGCAAALLSLTLRAVTS